MDSNQTEVRESMTIVAAAKSCKARDFGVNTVAMNNKNIPTPKVARDVRPIPRIKLDKVNSTKKTKNLKII